MTAILSPLMVLAAIGLVLSVGVHVASLFGLTVPGGKLVWGLHAGIFVVWLPTVLVTYRASLFVDRTEFWKVALAGCPPWARRALYVLFAYAVINFLAFVLLVNKAGVSEAERLRGFSGHWMMFYAGAFAVLYSAVHSPHLLQKRKCSRGHGVSPLANFCPKCGEALPPPSNTSPA